MKNTIFCGRPNYVGPKKGWFGLLHHDRLYEESHNVMERVDYTKAHKPANEVEIRLHNMIYLGGCAAVKKRKALTAGYYAKLKLLDADYNAKCKPLADDYYAKCKLLYAEILAYILSHIPDCPWDGETIFPEVKP
jgi:hypothetical protein